MSKQIGKYDFEAELLAREMATRDLLLFTVCTFPNFEINWHHEEICNVLTDFALGKIKKLMIFAPPQTGKTELSTRRLSAFLLGINPDARIGLGAYNKSRASKYAKDTKRIIESDEYLAIFPNTRIGSNARQKNYSNRSDYFEITGHKGSFTSAGIGTGLTGDPLDCGIIDDPIKDMKEANSLVYRDNIYDWYDSVFCTRFHNKSQQLLTVTRWHEDDLAGRILKREGDEWAILSFPAIMDLEKTKYDKREIGEVLWANKHSLERMEAIKERTPTIFTSLYQQRPSSKEGNIIKKSWLQVVDEYSLPLKAYESTINFVADTAYTKLQKNDPSGMMSYFVFNNNLYITGYKYGHWELSDLCKNIIDFIQENGNENSIMYVEPKASGKSAVQRIKEITNNQINIAEFLMAEGDKIAKTNANQPYFEAMRIFLLKGSWNEHFINEVTAFPKGTHDESIDCLNMSIEQGIIRGGQKPFDYGDGIYGV